MRNEIVEEAQSWIDPLLVAQMQIDFANHFRGIYDYDVGMMAVGPMQSFLGLMIKKGYIISGPQE